MSNEAEQSDQRRANLAALAALGVDVHPHRFETTDTVSALVERHSATPAADLEATRVDTLVAGRVLGIRSFGKASLPGPVRRALAPPGLPSPGRPVRARFRGVAAARYRRPRRRRRAPVPHQDRRAVGVGLVAHLPRQVLPAAAGEVARPERRRDPLPAALPGSGGEPRGPARLRGAQPYRGRGARVPDRPRLPRSRDADDAADRRRRPGPAVRHASQRARSSSSICASRPSSTSSAWSSAASNGSSRSTVTSGTRGSRPSTTPSSRCSSSIGPTWTTRR